MNIIVCQLNNNKKEKKQSMISGKVCLKLKIKANQKIVHKFNYKRNNNF